MIRSRRKQGAFTLLEMIVVLLVVSFIGTLLMQGLSYASKANQSLHQSLGRGQVRALTFDWFRDAVENLVAPEAGEVRWRLRGTNSVSRPCLPRPWIAVRASRRPWPSGLSGGQERTGPS